MVRILCTICFAYLLLDFVSVASAQCPDPAPQGQYYYTSPGNLIFTACDGHTHISGTGDCAAYAACQGVGLESATCESATQIRCSLAGYPDPVWNLLSCPAGQEMNYATKLCENSCPSNGTHASGPSEFQVDFLCDTGNNCALSESKTMAEGPYDWVFTYAYTGEKCVGQGTPKTPPDCGPGEHNGQGCVMEEGDDPELCGFGSVWEPGENPGCICPPGSDWDAGAQSCPEPTEPSCPAGWIYNPLTNNCVREDPECPAEGYTEEDGICIQDPDPEPDCPAGQVPTSNGVCEDEDPEDPDPEPDPDDVTCPDGYTYDGSTCSADDPENPDPEADPENCGEGFVPVDGTCQQLVPDPDGVCGPGAFPTGPDGECIVYVNPPPLPQPNPPDPGNNNLGCPPGYKLNQNPPLCLPFDIVALSGDCSIPPTCNSAEPIQCAELTLLYQIQCQGVTDLDELKQEIDKAFSDTDQFWQEVEHDIQTLDDSGDSGSCPADLTFSALGSSYDVPLDAICNFADMIKAIVLLSCFFLGGRIVIGGF